LNLLAEIGDPGPQDGGHATYRAYPSVKSVRWVLPTDPAYRRSAMAAYRPGSLAGRCLRALIKTGLMRGEAAPGAAGPLGRLGRFISEKLCTSDIALSLAVGTPGAYRKHTLRIMNRDGVPIAYAKLADLDLSKHKVATENESLARLSSAADLRRHVPQVLFFGELDDCLILLTTAGPDDPGPTTFSRQHAQFLRGLNSAFGTRKQIFATAFWTDVSARLTWLTANAASSWNDRLQQTVSLIRAELRDAEIPVSLAHRDFTPWNTRQAAGNLFVFDWEDAAVEVPALHDLLHFHAIQNALGGRPFKLDVSRIMSSYSEIVGASAAPPGHLRPLVMVYLLDLASYYLTAHLKAPDAGNSIVMDWAERELDHYLGSNSPLTKG
jgi:Phosphotransferase enzyme family